MTFFERLLEKLRNFGVADALQIIILAAVICFVLIYAKARNARGFSYFLIGYYALICVLRGFGAFAAEMFIALICAPALLLVLLFGTELKRDIFKISWKNYSGHLAYVEPEEIESAIRDIVKAAQGLSKKDTGALIIIAPDTIGEYILESGTSLNADVSCALLESIFVKDTPLHDGAVVIKGKKILAAGCYLPLSQDTRIPKELGTRHRSALGVTEINPSVTAIVVSEETGIISAMHDGKMIRYLDAERLEHALKAAYMLDGGTSAKILWRPEADEE